MRCIKPTLRGALGTAVLLLGSSAAMPLPAAWQDSQAPAADNTKVNKRDRKKSEVTADQQKMNEGDRELTQRIRKAIIADESLSTYAHNIKVISRNGTVTLKGPVRTAEEKEKVASLAKEAAGDSSQITNELSVKAH